MDEEALLKAYLTLADIHVEKTHRLHICSIDVLLFSSNLRKFDHM